MREVEEGWGGVNYQLRTPSVLSSLSTFHRVSEKFKGSCKKGQDILFSNIVFRNIGESSP